MDKAWADKRQFVQRVVHYRKVLKTCIIILLSAENDKCSLGICMV